MKDVVLNAVLLDDFRVATAAQAAVVVPWCHGCSVRTGQPVIKAKHHIATVKHPILTSIRDQHDQPS